MKQIKTIMLRLLIDPEHPAVLQGSFQPTLGEAVYLFKDEKSLLKVLHGLQIILQPDQDFNEIGDSENLRVD